MKLFDFLNLRNISGQIAALVIASIIAIHLILTAIFLVSRPDQPDPTIDRGHAQFAAAVLLLGAASAADRPRLFADIARAFPKLEIESLPPGPVPPAGDPEGLDLRSLHRRLDSSYRIFPLAHDQGRHKVGIALPDGAMISAKVLPDQRPRPFWSGPWAVTLLFAIVSLTLLGLWAARALTAPLSSFAKAAESFSLNGAAAPLPERGPEEIRSVAKALNRMRERITTLIDDRTRMLAAISHDLRTPITRMRLRPEFIDDAEQRTRMEADLQEMEAMIAATLSFARDEANAEPRVATDIAVLLKRVVEDAKAAGHDVRYAGPDHRDIVASPMLLRRAFANLIDNAIRYGERARVGLAAAPGAVRIAIEDDGPGIPESETEKVFAPFYRLEGSRSRETGGTGLGLSVARNAILGHGGTIELRNRAEGGLTVSVTLPG